MRGREREARQVTARVLSVRRRAPQCSAGGCVLIVMFANRFFPSKDYVVIDIHCHLLPEVDDGPKSWDAAVEMCRMAVTDGITHSVATPHANDRYAYDRVYLSSLLAQLQEMVGPSLRLTLGCDLHLSYENLGR